MVKEFDVVALIIPLPAEGLQAGDVGTVVYVHEAGRAFIVEFMTLEGETVAVATVEASQVRPASENEIKHAGPTTVR